LGLEGCWDWKGVGTGRVLGLEGCWDWKGVGTGRVLGLEGCWDWKGVGTGRVLGLEGCWDWKGVGTGRALGLEGRWDWKGVGTGRALGLEGCWGRPEGIVHRNGLVEAQKKWGGPLSVFDILPGHLRVTDQTTKTLNPGRSITECALLSAMRFFKPQPERYPMPGVQQPVLTGSTRPVKTPGRRRKR